MPRGWLVSIKFRAHVPRLASINMYNYMHKGECLVEWKYKEIYIREHPNARANGCVMEHRLVAEKALGRYLTNIEVVHHIDETRDNNSPENLIVFKTNADHARFHQTGVMLRDGDVYYSPKLTKKCESCGNEFLYSSNRIKYCDTKCSNLGNRKCERPTKDELLNLIMDKPFTHIAKLYNVSDSAVRKWCKTYELPYKKKEIKEYKLRKHTN